jgi:hypothetical protein
MTTPKHTFRFLCAASCLAASVLLTSCNGSGANILDPLNVDNKEEVYKPVVGEPGEFGVVSIHEIIRHKRGEEREIEIETMFEDEIYIDKNPLLDSSDIISIEAIAISDLPGFYKLRFHLTPEGGKIWRKLSVEGREDSPTLAFVIDGIVYRTFKPRFLYKDEDNVVIDGPFDEAAALNLEANAIRNFMHFAQ